MISPHSPDEDPSKSDRRFPAIRPFEEKMRQLEEKNENLEEELAVLRADALKSKLELKLERQRNHHLEGKFYSVAQDFNDWFEQAAFPMTCLDRDGFIIEANRSQLELLNCNRNDYVGKRIDSHLEEAEVLQQIVQALEGGPMPRRIQTSIKNVDGVTKPVAISCCPFGEGLSAGICCYMQDLSDLSQSRYDQERSEAFFRHVIEKIPDIFWLNSVDPDEMLYVSPRFENIWGESAKRLYEEPYAYLDKVLSEDRPEVDAHLERLQERRSSEVEYRVRCVEKKLYWVRERGFPVYGKDGSVDRIATLTEDITRSKIAEQRLQAWALQQEALARFGFRALVEESVEQLFDEANQTLVEILKADAVEILEFHKRVNSFHQRAGTGWQTETNGEIWVPGGENFYPGYTMARQEPVLLENLQTENRFHLTERFSDHGLVCGITVMLPGRTCPFGVLGVYLSQHRQFSTDEIVFLQSMASILANAIALGAQQRKLDDILETLPAVVWEAEVDEQSKRFQTTYISHYVETMLGFSSDEFLQKPEMWEKIVHKSDLPQLDRRTRELPAAEATTTDQFRGFTRDGRPIWMQASWRLKRDERNRLSRVCGVTLDVTDRKQAEEERWQLQQRFEDTLRHIPAIVWESRFDEKTGRFVPEYISEFAERLIPGFDREAWIQTGDLFRGIHPADKADVVHRTEAAFAGEKPVSVEFRWVSENGEIYWGESFKRAAYDKAGERIGVRGVIVDITERKRAELERQAADERFRDILANVPGIVWEMQLDPETEKLRMTFVSDYIENLSGGFTKKEFLSDPDLWTDRVHPEEREMVKERLKKLLQGQEYGSGLTRWIRKDGRTIWIESSQRIVFDESGRPTGLRGVTVDVTARKRAEIERNNTLQQFHVFMNYSPFAAVIKDVEGRYVYGNRLFSEWCQSMGLAWKGRKDTEMFPEEIAHRHSAEDRKALEKETETSSLEIFETPEGELRYWSIIRFPLPETKSGGVLGLLMVDVTERRALERKLLEISDREQQRLGQELHDGLCQHLLGLSLLGQTLANELESENIPQATRVRELSKFAHEALDLARGLMKSFNLIQLDGPKALHRALKDFLTTTGKLFSKNLQFESTTDVEIVDRDVGSHLFRIAQEATHNAIKHGDPTMVIVRLERADDSLLLIVENDGLPLPDPENRRRGMGLQTMHYRSDLIGAHLSFTDRPGGGVIVSCRLPAERGIRFAD